MFREWNSSRPWRRTWAGIDLHIKWSASTQLGRTLRGGAGRRPERVRHGAGGEQRVAAGVREEVGFRRQLPVRCRVPPLTRRARSSPGRRGPAPRCGRSWRAGGRPAGQSAVVGAAAGHDGQPAGEAGGDGIMQGSERRRRSCSRVVRPSSRRRHRALPQHTMEAARAPSPSFVFTRAAPHSRPAVCGRRRARRIGSACPRCPFPRFGTVTDRGDGQRGGAGDHGFPLVRCETCSVTSSLGGTEWEEAESPARPDPPSPCRLCHSPGNEK